MCIHKNIDIYICIHIYTCICIYIRTYIYIYIYTCMYVYMYIFIYKYIYVHVETHIHTHIDTHTYSHAHIYTLTHSNAHINTHIHTHTSRSATRDSNTSRDISEFIHTKDSHTHTLILQASLNVTVFVMCLVRDFGIWAYYHTSLTHTILQTFEGKSFLE